MIVSRFSWSARTLFSKQYKKKRPISGFLSDFSTVAKETNTQTHFQQPQVYFINRHSRKKNEPVHHSRTRQPRKTNYGKIGTV